jgi:predicted nuclease of restriction endonuclease-like (RecB) superfamily
MARKKKMIKRTTTFRPAGYAAFLDSLKKRIQRAQTKAILAANREVIQLYWDIGRLICERQEHAGWGQSVLERLADDLRKAFPGVTGFSRSNVFRMRAFYLAYRPAEKVAQAVRQTKAIQKVAQAVRQLESERPPAEVVALPWGHDVILIQKVKDRAQRLWYAAKTVEHGWSRAILAVEIETGLFSRHGKAVTNFEARLPAPQSDLAMQSFNTTIDEQLRHPGDAPTIGLILCKARDRLIAEYALRDIAKPIGVAQWRTKLVQSLPASLKGSLPSIEDIEAEFGPDE